MGTYVHIGNFQHYYNLKDNTFTLETTSVMSKESPIEELARELEKVKISHARTGKLLNSLHLKIESLRSPKTEIIERTVTLEECRYLLGKQVRIVNPGKGEGNIGTIIATGKLFITVDIGSGIKKNRVAKNLRLIEP